MSFFHKPKVPPACPYQFREGEYWENVRPPCLQQECAWWVADVEACAMTVLALWAAQDLKITRIG